MRLVIFGPQGAGKGTQSVRISEKYGVPAISTGDIFRWAMHEASELGKSVSEYVDSGRLVPDPLTIEIVRERLSQPDAGAGFLIDGFPRNVEQAHALDEILGEQGTSLDGAIVIEVPEDVSLRRITSRRVCADCGRTYRLDSPPEVDWTCDDCGAAVVERADDVEQETIRQRLRLYHEQTEPLKTYYEERGLLRRVDGEGTPDEVFLRIASIL